MQSVPDREILQRLPWAGRALLILLWAATPVLGLFAHAILSDKTTAT